MIKNRSKPTSGEFWWILGPRTVNFGPFGAAAGAPAESATGALAFYVLTLLDAKSRERVNSDLTQVGIGTQLDSFLLIVVQTSLPQPGSLTNVIIIIITIIIIIIFIFMRGQNSPPPLNNMLIGVITSTLSSWPPEGHLKSDAEQRQGCSEHV